MERERLNGLARGLGWFSIGLGAAELLFPNAMAAVIGVKSTKKTRGVLRTYGVRELTAGIGILAQEPAPWLWSRVGGDAVDLASLWSAMSSDDNGHGRLTLAMASVLGITALDVVCANEFSRSTPGAMNERASRVARSIVVGKPVEEVYQYWRNFENLPTFMEHLESVRRLGGSRSHWIAKGPAGARMEWDAETTKDEPNREIAWRSDTAPAFRHEGTVRFENAPGNRGTLVLVEMKVAPLVRFMGPDIGRRMMHDLRNFKQVMEVGEVTQSDSSIHKGMHPAQPALEGVMA